MLTAVFDYLCLVVRLAREERRGQLPCLQKPRHGRRRERWRSVSSRSGTSPDLGKNAFKLFAGRFVEGRVDGVQLFYMRRRDVF